MSKYITLDALKRHSIPHRKYPWDEWEKIPPGRALDISEHIGKNTAIFLAAVLCQTARKRGLQCIRRGDRVYMARPEEQCRHGVSFDDDCEQCRAVVESKIGGLAQNAMEQ